MQLDHQRNKNMHNPNQFVPSQSSYECNVPMNPTVQQKLTTKKAEVTAWSRKLFINGSFEEVKFFSVMVIKLFQLFQ